jgi:V8-like Glu-specific endopeptidase
MNTLVKTRIAAALFISLAPLGMLAQTPGSAPAVLGYSSSPVLTTQAATNAYWTPQRLLAAKPVALHPIVGADGLPAAAPASPVGNSVVKVSGAPPSASLPNAERNLIPEPYLEPDALAIARGTQLGSSVEPNGTSSFGAYFTTSRVFPNAATSTYPNRAAGKLFFSDPVSGGDFVCSASVLRHRIVVTAGHCVANPSLAAAQRYFFTNFMFVPAYRSGVAPIGTWTAATIFVTNAWYVSTGAVPNPQDVGMMVMRDNSGNRIGLVTGYLGYMTLQLAKNQLTMLGYPVNLDSGERMEINSAFTFGAGGQNTFIYGSAMRGGSSGGPWIVDHGVRPVGNPAIPSGGNYLVSVTSYGPVATEPKYQGASNLDARFISLLNAACATASGNCN